MRANVIVMDFSDFLETVRTRAFQHEEVQAHLHEGRAGCLLDFFMLRADPVFCPLVPSVDILFLFLEVASTGNDDEL